MNKSKVNEQVKHKLPTYGIPDVLCNCGKPCPECSLIGEVYIVHITTVLTLQFKNVVTL